MKENIYDSIMREELNESNIEIERKINNIFPNITEEQIIFLENLKYFYFLSGFQIAETKERIRVNSIELIK